MNNARYANSISVLLFFLPCLLFSAPNIGGISGSIQKTITNSAGDPANAPVFTVVSAGVTGDAIFSGQLASVTSTTISFESSSDSSEATVNPFISGVFSNSVKTPILTASLSGAGVGSVAITYAGTGFSTPPEIVIDYPTSGDDQATATASINGSGAITGISITSAGSGYSVAPTISVVGGPHLVKLTESGDDDEGRFFLITDNNATRLTLDISKLANGETLQNVLQTDFSVEVIAAPTLGSVFGTTSAALDLSPANANGSGDGADWVYLYFGDYYAFCFMPAGNGNTAGWYSTSIMGWGMLNDLVVYPDEAFIVAKRTNGSLTLDFEGGASTTDKKVQLPATGGAFVMNNPYGTDMLLAELIPSKVFGTSSSEFKPGSGDTDTAADQLYFLDGAVWSQFYYRSGVNDGVTATATATARAGTSGGGGLADIDVSLSAGTVTNLRSCTASGGLSVDHNDSNHTLVTLSGASAPLAGFDITFDSLFGKKLNDNGDKEVDVNGTEVSVGSGIKIFSGLIGTHKIIARPSGSTVVIRKRRDINFANFGSKTWKTGHGGGGYNGNAKAYFMGGGNTTMAVATATVSSGAVTGFSFSGTGNTRGAGYSYPPQVIISGGGWRKVAAANPNNVIKDGEILEATEGIVIVRKNSSGILTYFQPKNPFN